MQVRIHKKGSNRYSHWCAVQRRVANDELTAVGSVSLADGKAVWKGFWGPVCVRLKKAILDCSLCTVIVSRHDNKGQSSYLSSYRACVEISRLSWREIARNRYSRGLLCGRLRRGLRGLREVEKGWEGLRGVSNVLGAAGDVQRAGGARWGGVLPGRGVSWWGCVLSF